MIKKSQPPLLQKELAGEAEGEAAQEADLSL